MSMSKIKIYDKNSTDAVAIISNVEEHYCTNGMFYVKANGQEWYFSLESIGAILVETESEVKDIKKNFISKDVLDKIRAELIQSIQNGTLKIESGNEELFRIIDKYKESDKEKDVNCTDLCKSCITKGCMFQSGIVRNHCDFYKAERKDRE